MSDTVYCGWRLFSPTLLPDGTIDSARHAASRTHVVVIEDDQVRLLDLRLDVRNHSPTGFNWGYRGSGPAQLALAICCDCLGDQAGSDPFVYQQFKDAYVCGWETQWKISAQEIRQWADSLAQVT